jgi:hypothetical protein
MVRTEFGQNPSVSLKNSASSLVSESWSADNGVTNGIVYFLVVFLIQQEISIAKTDVKRNYYFGN